jgi:L-ascorbate metabolism protein UlaG (beta-lactamase superfamily)
MKSFKADIALVPLGQTYTMGSVQEAADSVLDSGASIAIPIHYGMYEGTRSDAEAFAKLLSGRVRVEILTLQK